MNLLKIILGKGDLRREIVVDEALICRSSGYFKEACDKSSSTVRMRTIILEEKDPHPFLVFLSWVWSDQRKTAPYCYSIEGQNNVLYEIIQMEAASSEKRQSSNEAHSNPQPWTKRDLLLQVFLLIDCCILADVLKAEEFHNIAINLIAQLSNKLYREHDTIVGDGNFVIDLIWDRTTPSSGLRKLIVDNLFFGNAFMRKIANPTPQMQEAYFDVMRRGVEFFQASLIVKEQKSIWYERRDVCIYHVHANPPTPDCDELALDQWAARELLSLNT